MLIDHINLSRVDLNLLVALDALLTDRSVTRAAARVGLRQSAMSYNLARLRTLLGDELLTRGPEGMRPTPRALALVDPVRITLAQITSFVSPNQTFDARTAERAFRIGLPDGAEVLLGPALLSYLRESAPGIRLRLQTTDRLFDELDADRLDFGIIFGPLPMDSSTTNSAGSAPILSFAYSTSTASAFLRRFRLRIMCGCRTSSPRYAVASKVWWTRRWRSSGSAGRSPS